jgi:DNA replication and repair protein RecF
LILSQIKAFNFRNYDELTIDFEEKKNINIIISANGMGKSNLLELIYYFSYLRPFRNVLDREIVKKGKNFFFIECQIKKEQSLQTISVKYHKTKEIYFNKKKIKKFSDILGKLLTVLFCNEDLFIINGPPIVKRKFFDLFFSTMDTAYLYNLKKYQLIIKNKNVLLKKNNGFDLIKVYNQQLTPVVHEIIQTRTELINKINSEFQEIYQSLGNYKDKVKLVYQNCFGTRDISADIILQKLNQSLKNDIDAGYATLGPHRDNYYYFMNGISFAKYASFGQTRLAALVVKIIQAKFYKSVFQIDPILLLDDVILELDKIKQTSFIDYIANFHQIFLTVTSRDYLKLFKNKENINEIQVEHGKIL